MAFLGWQFDVQPSQGLTFTAPIAPVEGLVRASHIELARPGGVDIPLTYCASETGRDGATLTFRARMDETPRPLPRDGWQCVERRLLRAPDVRRRHRDLRGRLPGEGFTGRRPRPGRHPRLRVVSQARARRRHAARDACGAAAGHRLRLLAERPLPARVRSRWVQCRRARPGRVRWADDFVRRRGRRQLQSPLRDARAGRQLRALRAASGGSAAVHRRGTAGQGARRAGHAEDLLHVLVHGVLGARGIAHAHDRGRPRRRAAGRDLAAVFPGRHASLHGRAAVDEGDGSSTATSSTSPSSDG